MSYIFQNCSSLSSLPDISKWNTNNVANMENMFYGCSSELNNPLNLKNNNKGKNLKKLFKKIETYINNH